MNNIKRYKNLGDFHTHTVYSLHGMSSPSEMVDAAINKGLEYIAITDHYYPKKDITTDIDATICNPIFLKNQSTRLQEMETQFKAVSEFIEVIPGYEHNFFSASEPADLAIKLKDSRAFNIIGLHNWFYNPGMTHNNLLPEIEKEITRGAYQCFAHPEREIYNFCGFPNDKEKRSAKLKFVLDAIVELCHQNDVIIEVNESSITRDYYEYNILYYMKHWLKMARDLGCLIVVNSDAHSKYGIGKIGKSLDLLEGVNYPVDLIVNFDRDKIKYYIQRQIAYKNVNEYSVYRGGGVH